MLTTDSSQSRDDGSDTQTGDADLLRLLRDARNGDRESLGQLLQWYGNYLTILARSQLDRRLCQRLNPSDIVQETMLAAHRDFADFRGQSQGELFCWLRSILIHTLHRSFQKHIGVEKRDIRREVSLEQVARRLDESARNFDAMLPGRGESPSDAMQQRETAVELANQLSRLKPDYRDVITLRVLRGMSFEEIAEQIGRKSGAVRMLWLRALEAFKTAEYGR